MLLILVQSLYFLIDFRDINPNFLFPIFYLYLGVSIQEEARRARKNVKIQFQFPEEMSVISIILGLIASPILLVLIFALKRRQRCPEKSFLNHIITISLTPARFFKLGPYKQGNLTLKKACEYAKKKTGLSDFGNPGFLELYNLVMDTETHRSQTYHNLGYIAGRIEINMTMVRRLKFLQYIKDVPALLNVPVRSPVFVMGLPRTGNIHLRTQLQHMLNMQS